MAFPVRISRTCVCSTSRILLDRFARHSLADWHSLPKSGFARHRLAYPMSPQSKLHSPTSLQPFRYPVPWSAYVRLLSVRNESAHEFYEAEALRGGWSVRHLNRQISSQFYEHTALSKDKAAMLAKAGLPNKVMAAEYRIALPDEAVLAAEPDRPRKAIELRGSVSEVGVGEAL